MVQYVLAFFQKAQLLGLIKMDEKLPTELLEQLTTKKPKDIILQIIKDKNSNMSVDEILVAYWKITQKVITRGAMICHLHRLKKTGFISGGSRTYIINNQLLLEQEK